MKENKVADSIVIALLMLLTFSFTFGAIFAFLLIFCSLKFTEKKKISERFAILFVGNLLGIFFFALNPFFCSEFKLLILAAVYFSGLFTLELFFLSLLTEKNYGVIYSFCFVLLFNLMVTVCPKIFPLFFTLGLYNYDFLNFITTNIPPVVLEAFFVAVCVCQVKSHNLGFRKTVLHLLILVLCIIVAIVILFAKKHNKHEDRSYEAINIGFVQGAYTSKDYGYADNFEEYAAQISEFYLDKAHELKTEDLVIIPEGSFIGSYEESEKAKKILSQNAENNRQYIIADFHLPDTNGKDNNKLIMLKPDGNEEIYIKNSLVPFAETDNVKSGKEKGVFHYKNKTIIPMVCYDSVFLDNYKELPDADLIVVVSNDSLSDGIGIPMLHESITKMYAKSVKIPLLFISQSTRCFFVNGEGVTTVFTKQFQRGIFREKIVF